MHTLGAGEYYQRRKVRCDQPIKICGSTLRESAPVNFGIINSGTATLQFIAKQVTALLAAQDQDALALNLLQFQRL